MSTVRTSPVVISPLFRYDVTSERESVGRYRTVQRLVTTVHNVGVALGEVETCLDEYLAPNGERLWRRLVVFSGPGNEGSRSVHASYALPNSIGRNAMTSDGMRAKGVPPGQSLFCWASFADRRGHKLLCALSTPSLLCIWDVYPSPDGSVTGEAGGIGEGHSIPLPFEACAVYPLGESHGLVLQRIDTFDDGSFFEFKSSLSWAGEVSDVKDEDVVLSEPPKPRRVGGVRSPAAADNSLRVSVATPNSLPYPSTSTIPSLFALRHPLDEVLPIATTGSYHDQTVNLMSDVYEKVLFIGTPRWTDVTECRDSLKRKEHQQPICVTYHSRLKRHAVWTFTSAPQPPSSPPLWQISRNQRIEESTTGKRGNLDVMEHTSHIVDERNLHIVGLAATNSPRDEGNVPLTQKEALADLLGVRQAKKTEDGVSNPVRRRSGSFSPQPSSFLSPPPVNTDSRIFPTEDGSDFRTDDFMAPDKHEEPRFIQPPGTAVAPSNFGQLHPYLAMNLLYDDSLVDTCYEQASNVFLASNVDGTGTLLLCLECPVRNRSTPSVLRCFSLSVECGEERSACHCGDLIPDNALFGHISSLSSVADIACLSAQPVQAIPLSPLCRPHCSFDAGCLHEHMATDILILKGENEVGGKETSYSASIGLYRGGNHIFDCVLGVTSETETTCSSQCQSSIDIGFARVLGIGNPVANKMDFVCRNDSGEDFVIRGSLSIALSSSCERILGATESALVASMHSSKASDDTSMPIEVEAALSMRADCITLRQALSCGSGGDAALIENPSWFSTSTVISTILNDLIVSGCEGAGNEPRTTEFLKTTRCPEGKTDWSCLLQSDFNENYVTDHDSLFFLGCHNDEDEGSSKAETPSEVSWMPSSLLCLEQSRDDTALFASCIFDALHLLYEEIKLSRTLRNSYVLRGIGSILACACVRLEQFFLPESDNGDAIMGDFLDHYSRDLGHGFVERTKSSVQAPRASEVLRFEPESCRGFITSFNGPPCFFSWIDGVMKGLSEEENAQNVFYTDGPRKCNEACSTTRFLHSALSILFRNDRLANPEQCQGQKDREVVSAMIQYGVDDRSELKDELPHGVALPLLETLVRCRGQPPSTSFTSWPAAAWHLIGRDDLGHHCSSSKAIPSSFLPATISPGGAASLNLQSGVLQSGDEDKDGTFALEVAAAVRFPEDNRVREAGRLLRSSRPSYLRVERAVETSDHDYERQKQEKLLVLCRRVLSLPLGRGMLTIGTLQPVPAEPLPVPDLCLSGRVPPTNATLALDISGCPPDMKVWPEFHNGVAAGLRLPDADCTEVATYQITRTWIVYNRLRRRDANTNRNSSNDGADESTNQTDHVYGGLLLALGLRGHLSTLSMTDTYDYLTEGTVTTTVGILLGMAANRRGSCDAAISKILCLHIPSLLPPTFAAIDVASPAQSAAIAGVGLLYQGSSHRLMTEFLLNEMAKGPLNHLNGSDRTAYVLSCGLALGMVNLSRGDQVDGWAHLDSGGSTGLADLRIGERLHRFIVGGTDDTEIRRRRESADRASSSSGVEAERCSRTYEGGIINTAVTAPGAILALGLMYLQSGNQAVASSLSLPDTHFLLEYVRPDLLLLRVVAYSLVLWDDVVPSSKWIEDQIPSVIRKSYGRMGAVAKKFSDVQSESGLGSSSAIENDRMWQHMTTTKEESSCLPEEQEVDRQAVRQIHAHVVAGACFGIGLRYAGTGDKQAASAIYDRVMAFVALRDDPATFALKPEQPVLDTCMGCAAIALAMVLAGTGDLEALKLFKMLRWRCDEDVKYGSHMAFGAAIGLLFLGGGNCTLGRDPEDIAVLLMAFFPRFPSSSSDNQYHLQALRHCYALAVKHRGLRAFDVDTKEEVFIPIQLEAKDEPRTVRTMTTPCLLQDTAASPTKLTVVSKCYYPLVLNLGKGLLNFDRSLFVKKRGDVLGYFQDPQSQHSVIIAGRTSSWCSLSELLDYFSLDQRVESENSGECGFKAFSTCSFSKKTLPGSSAYDNDALALHVSLKAAVASVENKCAVGASTVWDLCLVRTYYRERHRIVQGDSEFNRLLSPEFVAFLMARVQASFTQETASPSSATMSTSVGRFVTRYGIPYNAVLSNNVDMETT